MIKRILPLLLTVVLVLSSVVMVGCNSNSSEFKDGYYTAEDKNGSHGWYEYITIYVNDGKIVSVEYNAKNASGFIKSWDMDYMRIMNSNDGTYPNEYTRYFADQLLNAQSSENIDAITGATHSYNTFQVLAKEVLEKARAGDTTVELVDVDHGE